MSTTIDERVVEMRFDNKQFEAGVQTSLSTLDKLKKGLDLDGAAKGFDQLSVAAKKCDMSMLGRSIETVQQKFSAFEVVAMTALSNITNSAVNTGKRLLSSLTIEPVSTGFNEYELKMGSIQTIMASTGESLDKVNQKLDELNKYSDRTIYSFSDMTTNIGKFTNAGVKLDDAVAAIQGVSNVAAVSGANANEASRAMYNFAQALSAGYVKLIDWKSIENANMATVEFKTQLLESAVAAGTLTRTADGMYKTLEKGTVIDATHLFNDSLQEQWMTTEVLTETLKDYADETTEIGKKAFAAAQDVKTWTQLLDTLKESAQSGWAETWQLVAGDYEEAKATLRTFSEFFSSIIDGSAEARNALLEGALMSSWGQIKNRVNETGISVDSFRDTLRETAESSVEGLDKIIEEAGSFDAALSKGWLTTDILSDTLDNLVSKAAGTQVSISELSDEQLQNIGYTQEQIEALRALSEEAKSSESNLASLVKTLDRQSGRELLFDSLLNGAKAVQGLFQTIKGAWQDIFPPATSEQLYSFIEALHSASERIRDFFTQAEEGADGFTGAINKPLQDLGNTFKGLFAILDIVKQAFSALWRVITPAGSAVGGLLTGVLGLTGSFGEWLAKLDESIKKGGVFYKGLKSIVDVVKGAITAVTGFAAAIGESLGFPGLDGATASVEAFLGTLKEKVSAPGLEKLQAIFDGICARAKWVKDAIVGMKDGVVDSMGKIDGAVSGNKFVQVLAGIGTLIREVASAVAGLLGKAIDGLINTLSNANFNGILDFLNALAAGGIIAAIHKFIDPVEELENTFISLKDWVKGLGGGVTKILDGVRGSLEAWQTKLKSDALGKIAASIAVLSVSLLVLSSIDSDKVTGSLTAMVTMFTELIASMAVLDKLSIDGKSANKTASAMIKMGAALLILSLAMKNIAELNPEQLAEGLIGVGVLLAEVDLFLNTAKFDKKASKSATGMILFAAAIKILSSAVKSLGEMDWDDMAKGLVGVGVLLAEVEVFLNNAKFNGKAVLTATGIVILSSAIKVLASSCKDFGSMSWGEITKGLTSIAALLLEITAFTKLTGDAKHVVSTGLALIEIAAAMKIFASAMSDFGSMSGSEIAKGLMAMGGALAEVAIAVNLMPKNMVSVGTGLVIVGAALKIVASALSSMGNMSWESIAKGLVAMGGALAELAIGLNVMNGTLAGSAALLVAAGALTVLTPVLVILGNMSWESIAKGLITIAGAFTVMGVAGAVLGPLAPSILAISGALALLGVGSVAIGAGLTLIGTGLTSIAVGLTSLAASFASSGTLIVGGLSAIVLGFAGLIPAIAEKIGEAIVAFCGAISSGAPAIGEAVKAIVLTLVDVLVQCVPAIADGALQLVTGVLASLVAYTPQIVDSVMQFLIEVLEGIARNIPQLVQAAMDVVGAFFAGVLSALSNIDSSSLIQGIAAVGLLTALVAALGAVSGLIPAAMAGVLGMGVVITELSVVLAAIGALAQIPGLEWLISEGGQFLQTVGNAIGGFVGGIVGGFMSGVSSSFPQIGADLSSFMTNVKPFIDGAGSISPDMLTGVKALTEAIILITAADLLEGLTSWLTGGSSLSDFAKQLVPFGESMMKFSNTISGLDGGLVSTAAIAGKTLAEMAATLPNSGGVVGFFAGENDMEEFGNQLSGFGKSMMDFADSIKGLDSDAVQNAAIAGKAMAEMAATLPNTGGAVSFFTGNNDMDTFGDQLVPFGKAIKEYSDAVAGLDADAVVNSATAGKSLVELANTIPNTGGAVAFFTGDNDLATFGEQIVVFGRAMKEYSQTVSGLDAEAVTNSATAGAILVELANTIPNTGGLVSFFAGDNDLETFGEQIVPFGEAMKAYSDSITGIDAEAVAASTTAAQALAQLQSTLPNMGGLVDFFTGSNDLSTFAEGIIPFGEAMKSYGQSVTGIDAEAINASAVAAQALSQLQVTLPNVGGVMEFFTGGNDLGKFSEGLVPFGVAMKSYGDSVSGINAEAITASATAAKSLAELQSVLPNVGGVMEFFTGGNDLGTFAAGIIPFGAAMKSYGEAVADINAEAITASAIAAQSLAQLQTTLPAVGGVMEFFTGGNDLATFAATIVPFGAAMKSYGEAVAEINTESITASAIAAQSLAQLQTTLPQIGGVMEFFTGSYDLSAFGVSLIPFGQAMNSYGAAVAGIDAGAVMNSATAGQALVELANTLPKCGGLAEIFTGGNSLATFGDKIVQFGKDLSAYANAIKDVKPDIVTASANAAQALSNLATGLPDSSLFDKWFGGDQTLASFGKDIASFGADMSNYYAKVASIDLTKLAGVITQVWSLVDLAKGVKGLDANRFTSFGNALKAMANTGISEFTSAFSNSTTEVNKAVQGMLNSVSASILNGKKPVIAAVSKIMTAIIKSIIGYRKDVIETSKKLIKAAADSITTGSKDIEAATVVLLDAAIKVLSNSHSEFVTLGLQAGAGFASGIKMSIPAAMQAGASLGTAALTSAAKALDSHSPSRKFMELGENSGEGYAIGVEKGTIGAVAAVETMYSKVYEVSEHYDCGNTIAEQVEDGCAQASNSIEAFGNRVENTTERVNRSIQGISGALYKFAETAEKSWRSGDLEGEVAEINALREMRNTTFALSAGDALKQWEEERAKLLQELDELAIKEQALNKLFRGDDLGWDGISTIDKWLKEAGLSERSYSEFSALLHKRDSEIQARLQEGSYYYVQYAKDQEMVIQSMGSLEEQVYQRKIENIQHLREMNRISGEEELAMYDALLEEARVYAQERLNTGDAELYKSAEERVMALEEKLHNRRIELKQEQYQRSMDWIEEEKYYNRMSLSDELAAYKRVQSRYEQGTEERKKMDREIYRLEKEISDAQTQYIEDIQQVQSEANQKRLDLEQEYADKVKSINDKLAQDIQSLNDQYENALKSRENTLYKSYGIFDEIGKREEVSGETLMKNLEGQVKEFGEWQDILDRLSARGLDVALIEELREMGPDAISQIKALNSMSDSELEKYASLWSIKHAQAREQAVSELEGLRVETQNNIAQLRIEADKELEEYRSVWQSKMAQVTADADAELERLRKEFSKKVGLIKTDTEDDLKEMSETAQRILKEAGWDETGKQIVTGLTEGVQSERSSFIDELTNMALAGVEAVKDTLDINSPSRVFQELGNYTGLGFVKGLTDYANKSYDAAANVAGYAANGLSNAISKVSDLVNGEFDMQPTIRPVLDFTDVARGAGELNSLLGYTRTLAFAGQTSLAFNSTLDKDGMTVTVDNDGVVQELRSLRSEMAEMTARLERMQVVLDTGTLVGQMADPLDSALGQKQTFRGRGI